MARYWLINTVATAVPLSAHPSPLVITCTTKLAAAMLGGCCSEEVFCRPSTAHPCAITQHGEVFVTTCTCSASLYLPRLWSHNSVDLNTVDNEAGGVLHRRQDFIANRTCNTTLTGSCCIRYSRIWHDPVIFPVIGPSVLSAANQNASGQYTPVWLCCCALQNSSN